MRPDHPPWVVVQAEVPPPTRAAVRRPGPVGPAGSSRWRRGCPSWMVGVGSALRAGPFVVRGSGTTVSGGGISAEPRINDRIRVPEVRLVGPEGEQVGIVAIGVALQMAPEHDLDLVEVAPMARPPVAKLMDYGKFKYETAQKARESRKNQVLTVIKEMKLRPKIDPHDYETKKGHVVRFLKQGDKVKITIMFRGREQSRPELGFRLLQRLGADVEELGFVESSPKQDGRNMIMVIAPHKNAADLKKIAADTRAAEGSKAGQVASVSTEAELEQESIVATDVDASAAEPEVAVDPTDNES